MADQIYYSVFTQQGLALLTEAIQNGTKLGITSMAFGDGGGSLPEPQDSVTALVNEVHRTQLNSLAPDPNNANWLRAEAIIASAIGGFNIRELGLYAGDVLVAYSNYPSTYKPNPSDGTARIMTFRMVLQIDNTANFDLVIDPDVVLATIQYVDNVKQELSNLFNLNIDYVEDLNSLFAYDGRTVTVNQFSEDVTSEPLNYRYDSSKKAINNGGTIINGWIAQLKGYVTPEMFGSKGGIDETELLLKVIDYASENKLDLIFKSGKEYFTQKISHYSADGYYVWRSSNEQKPKIIYNVQGLTESSLFIQIGGKRDDAPTSLQEMEVNSTKLMVDDSSVFKTGDMIRLYSTRLYQSTENRGWYCEGQMNEIVDVIDSTSLRLAKPLNISIPQKKVCTGVLTEFTDAWHFTLDENFTFEKPYQNLKIEIGGITQYIYKYDESTRSVTIGSTWRTGFPDAKVGDTYKVTYEVIVSRIQSATVDIQNIHFHSNFFDLSTNIVSDCLQIAYCKDPIVKSCQFSDFAGSGCIFMNCVRHKGLKNVGYRLNSASNGCLIQTHSSSGGLVAFNIAYGSRRTADVHGVSTYCTENQILDNIHVGGGRAADGSWFWPQGDTYCGCVGSHGGSLGTLFSRNIGINSQIVVNLRGQHEFISENIGFGSINMLVNYFGGGGASIKNNSYKTGWAELSKLNLDTTYIQHADEKYSWPDAGVVIDTADIVLDYPIDIFDLNLDQVNGCGVYLKANDAGLHPYIRFRNIQANVRFKKDSTYFALVRLGASMETTNDRIIDLGGHVLTRLDKKSTLPIYKYTLGTTGIKTSSTSAFQTEIRSFQCIVKDDDFIEIPIIQATTGVIISIHEGQSPDSRKYAVNDLLIRAANATAYKDGAAFTSSNNLAVGTTRPTGTTGTDGKVTMSYVNGSIFLENRNGTEIRPIITIKGC